MRRSFVLTAVCLAAVAFLLPAPPAQAQGPGFNAPATLTYLGAFGGQQRYRFDYTLVNLGEPLGLTAIQVFFNSDPATQLPSGDRATLVSYGSPGGWGDVVVDDKNPAGQWAITWNYDFVTPPGPLMLNQSLAGFSVVFDWNDPTTVPPIQHAEARNGRSFDHHTDITGYVGLVGEILGMVHVDCLGAPQPAGGITVTLLHNLEVYATTATEVDGAYAFGDVPLGTYTVVVTPPAGYGTPVDNQVTLLQQVGQSATADFSLTCQLGNVRGSVTGSCNGQSAPLQGVTVDLFSVDGAGHEVLAGTAATDAGGQFAFNSVALGDYSVSIVTPLGYVADANSKPLTLSVAGATVNTSFALACQSISAEPRTIGYWKHQVSVYLSGRGSAQESLSDMLRYIDQLLVHFNENIVNPVIVYVPASSIPGDQLRKMDELLTVNRGATMLDRAKQQLLALLLNVVSGKIAQTQVISANGATVSQAITYANDLIQDGNPANDETAKTIADTVNNGARVPSGMIPISTRIITYSRPRLPAQSLTLDFRAPSPNPSRGRVALGFSIPRAGTVELRIFDLRGRVVRTLVQGELAPGVYEKTWDATDEAGRSVPSGVYYSRLATADGAWSRPIAIVR